MPWSCPTPSGSPENASRHADLQNERADALQDLTRTVGMMRVEPDSSAFHALAADALMRNGSLIPGFEEMIMRADLAVVPRAVLERVLRRHGVSLEG